MTTQSNVSTLPAVQQRRSILNTMANSYGMEPAAFEATVRATCMKPDRKTGAVPSREEFAAFLLVAKEFDLNPLTKEIYAFPAKGGGIIPIVSIDGWCNLINSNKNFNGMNFEIEEGKDGKPLSCTCTIYRKDRDRDIIVTEYFSECRRDTDPWKSHPRRMLRHKALIQCARYAFGFAGIYDEDEAERIAKDGVNTVIVQEPPAPPPPPAEIEGPAREPEETQEQDNQPEQEPVETVDFEPLVAGFESDAATALSEDDLDEYFAGAREVLADMPQELRIRVQNAYEGAQDRIAQADKEAAARVLADTKAREEQEAEAVTEPRQEPANEPDYIAVDADLASKGDPDAELRVTARKKAASGAAAFKRWLGGRAEEEMKMLESMPDFAALKG